MTDREVVPPVRAPADEEKALHESAVAVLRDSRCRWLIAGPKAGEVLNGLVTNDVSALKSGSGCYAAALTPKGKIVADLRIFATAGGFVADAESSAADGLASMLRKYVNPRLARITDVTQDTFDVAVAGPAAAEVIERALGMDAMLNDLPAHAHVQLSPASDAHLVTRTPELGVAAFDLIVPAGNKAQVFGALTEAGAVPASHATWEAARIERGWPVWGKDMDENTLAQEANLDALGAISYTKGCYTGQETVARVHFRGHVNRYLRRVRFEAREEVPRGASVAVGEKEVGDVRSAAITSEAGFAIAMLRREVTDTDAMEARWNGRSARLSLV